MIQAPNEPALTIDSVQDLITNMLVDAGIVGIDEAIEPAILNRAFRQVNWIIDEWARKRWLVYRIQDYHFVCTGQRAYTVGLAQTVNINPRPDRLEYAFLRFLNNNTGQYPGGNAPAGGGGGGGGGGDFNARDWSADWNGGQSGGGTGGGNPGGGNPGAVAVSQGPFFVDIQLEIIPSHEDYSRITVKNIGTLAWKIFYDPAWPIGLLRPWPVPQATIYEIHVGFKCVLPRFQSLQQKINFPPEYEMALNWAGARRLRASYQMPADPAIDGLARNGLNTIRLGNQAMSTLRMPPFLRRNQRAYDYRGDGS
jgi:hypothetical protein